MENNQKMVNYYKSNNFYNFSSTLPEKLKSFIWTYSLIHKTIHYLAGACEGKRAWVWAGFGSCVGDWGTQNSVRMNNMGVTSWHLNEESRGLLGLKADQLMRSTLGATKTLHVVGTLECGENTRVWDRRRHNYLCQIGRAICILEFWELCALYRYGLWNTIRVPSGILLKP